MPQRRPRASSSSVCLCAAAHGGTDEAEACYQHYPACRLWNGAVAEPADLYGGQGGVIDADIVEEARRRLELARREIVAEKWSSLLIVTRLPESAKLIIALLPI